MSKQRVLVITTILLSMILAGCAGGTAPVGQDGTEQAFSPARPSDQALPEAEIENDEGGPEVITGEVAYTNPFFTLGVAEPLVILEDQAGFVDRDRNFIFPTESQVLGQITSDFFTSPFEYSLTLPETPHGTLRDVNNDGSTDTGVMTFAIAYWTNTWGDPYLEKRDQHGGGWSSAYASTQVSDDRDTYLEITGGNLLIFAPDDQQGFPSGFGDDEMLFTQDDPIVRVPQGWTVVNLDSDPFTFDRSVEPVIPLLEPQQIALDDFSDLGYVEAFDAMLEKLRTEYAFTELKGIDWAALSGEYRPVFEEAEQSGNPETYFYALRDFLWSIPDGHISMDTSVFGNAIREEISGGLGLSMRELDDGRFLVDFMLEGSPADVAGIALGAEILALDGTPAGVVVSSQLPWSSPFSTEESKRLQQIVYATRFPLGTDVEVTFRNPGASVQTRTLTTVREFASFENSSVYPELSGYELPVEFSVLDDGYGYVRVMSFSDNEVLTIQLWERMVQDLNNDRIPGLVIDLRSNGGGSGFLADQMAAYFFDQELVVGNTGFYDDSTGEFYTDPGDENLMFPPREELQYAGPIAVLVGPACASACEFFAYDLTIEDRATIMGHYASAGLGGSVEDFLMPEYNSIRFTIGRAVDPEGKIHIEGKGVIPEIRIPVTEENLLARILDDRDVELEEALAVLMRPEGTGVAPEGMPRVGTPAEAETALQNDAPLLEELALETYDQDLSAPTTFAYTVPLVQGQETIWASGWCAEPNQFAQNWANIELEMMLHGEEVPLDQFAKFEFDTEGQRCRFYFTVLSDWPLGEHVLQTSLTFTSEMSDGVAPQPYAPGTRLFEYRVIARGS